jgi:AcrR family transcriptional regulator
VIGHNKPQGRIVAPGHAQISDVFIALEQAVSQQAGQRMDYWESKRPPQRAGCGGKRKEREPRHGSDYVQCDVRFGTVFGKKYLSVETGKVKCIRVHEGAFLLTTEKVLCESLLTYSTRVLSTVVSLKTQTLLPRKTPRQARSNATVEVILQAATRVLSESSLAGFTTNRVAEVAGVSIGSLYQYFPNKAALVSALIVRAQESLLTGVEQAVKVAQGKSVETLLLALVDAAIEHQFAHPVLATALDHEEQRLPLAPMISHLQGQIVTVVHQALRSHTELARRRISLGEVQDCLLITKALVDAEATRPTPSPQQLRRRALRALSGYLT